MKIKSSYKFFQGKLRRLWLSCAVIVAFVSGCSEFEGSFNKHALSDEYLACEVLKGLQISPASIGLPTSGAIVESSRYVTKTASEMAGSDFCEVKGWLLPVDDDAPRMEFQVNLPNHWNGRALQVGGGGNNGVLITGLDRYQTQAVNTPHPLAEGYMTLGSDGGHQGAHLFDFRYALNDEALQNYVDHSIKKAHDVAKVLAHQRYGKAPDYFYFIGLSKGGHEAIAAAVRYPEDYDGVMAVAPAYNMTRLFTEFLDFGQSIYKDNHAGWINDAKRELLVEKIYAACDTLDNLEDGIISNISACNQVFTIDTVKQELRCEGGFDVGDHCFSDGQIRFLEAKSQPKDLGFAIDGQRVISGWPLLDGSDFLMKGWLPSFGYSPRFLPKHAPIYLVGAGHIKYFVTRDLDLDPMAFDPKEYQQQLQKTGRKTDLTSASLQPFKDKGGKMILLHGALDSNIGYRNSVDYYNLQVQKFGEAQVNSFLKFYVAPGYDHGFGRYDLGMDGLGKLAAWVEQGQAPDFIETIDNNGQESATFRSRPLCPWPTYAHFIGDDSTKVKLRDFNCIE